MTDKIDAVQRMQSYIENHLEEEISLTTLARQAMFSPWYSSKIFKELTGLSPMEYIRRSKLSKSALKLRDSDVKIVDLAFEMGFESVDGYQRAFKSEFGCNPKEYAKRPIPLPLFTPYGVKFKELYQKERSNMSNVRSVFIQVVEKPLRKVIIKRAIKADNYWDYCQEVGCDVWGVLKSIKSIGNEPVCMWLPKKYIIENSSIYVQGVEVDASYDGVIPQGFDVITLPQAKYLMFQGQPFKEENFCEAIEELQESIKNYDPKVIGMKWDDDSPEIQLEPIGERGYIELKGVKNLL